ncbi:MAG: FAD-dependent oxidoreductase [Rhizobacter sp.]|nr:FAD-dependent oxidoreductase [Rhizobacter sp.]
MGQGPALSGSPLGPTRRSVLAAAAFALGAPLAACSGHASARWQGGWIGTADERGHRVRDGWATTKSGAPPAVARTRRVDVLVVGAGIAGLAAARALRAGGVDDCHVLELEDRAGGNSRGHAMAGMRCPLGAHYLPVPGPAALEVGELLEELGVRRSEHGRVVYDERLLCHSPQERIFVGGGWRDGVLPPIDALPASERAATLAQYRAFAAAVAAAGDTETFAIPTARSRWSEALTALDHVAFAAWLDAHGFFAPALRWYLDYCCRDDYGAGSAHVSAWAGLHYFASRHGFRAPGDERGDLGETGVLTWPEGNAWLAERLAAPLGERLHTGRVVLAVEEGREEVAVDAWNVTTLERERWSAPRVVLATPLFVSARVLASPPRALREAAACARHAPWLVANLQLDDALDDRPGAPPSWDNVFYGSTGLGYVDAMHQSTLPFAGATVLTAYFAFGSADAHALGAERRRLLAEDWQACASRVVAELASAHPDLAAKVRRIDLMRYGHAMSIPVPGVRSSPALAALAAPQRRVHFAHADLSSYSVFEEAFFHGTRAGRAALQ